METIRAFVAVELPEEIRYLLGNKQDELRAAMGKAAGAVRWSRPDGAHLTLQFLGDVPVDVVPRLEDAVIAACDGLKPLDLALGRTGAFPGITRPRVIWIGLEGDIGRLQALQTRVAARLTALGYKPDKPFQPHITLGRMRETARREEIAVTALALRQQENRPIKRGPFTASHVSLMQSELQPGGSVYTELGGVELGWDR